MARTRDHRNMDVRRRDTVSDLVIVRLVSVMVRRPVMADANCDLVIKVLEEVLKREVEIRF